MQALRSLATPHRHQRPSCTPSLSLRPLRRQRAPSRGAGRRPGSRAGPRCSAWGAEEQSGAETATNRWIDDYIIGLDLCPFAKPARQQTRVRVCAAESAGACLEDLREELALLALQDEKKPSTTVLVLPPGVAGDFATFMDDFLEPGLEAVQDLGLGERIQLVPFHPDAQYSDAPDDCSDYALRSPFPTIHLLRQCDVDRAIAAWADKGMFTSEISDSNAARLQGLGPAALEAILRGLMSAPGGGGAAG